MRLLPKLLTCNFCMHANALNSWSFASTIDRNFNNLSLLFDLEVYTYRDEYHCLCHDHIMTVHFVSDSHALWN